MSKKIYSEIYKKAQELMSKGYKIEDAIDEAMRELNPVYKITNLKLLSVERGRAKALFIYSPMLTNPDGSIHGGIIATLIDQVGAIAAWSTHMSEQQVTMELKINYLLPMLESGSPFTVEGSVVHAGKRSIVTLVTIKSSKDETVAIATGTWYKLSD
ncbi:PaaI family thioesterase [Fervidicoccus fontis]|jgi:acyl-CoA thioesterase|nr:PaaI family thioesterase [Fervidicoccus fontis]PMB77167.1 MAG: hypothetical protein C0177_04105 [Fervidicoccus fontis]